MRSLILSLVAIGQLAIAARPALAAELDGNEQSRMGMFGGVQIQMPLGRARVERPRASLTLAPTMRSQRIDGASATRVGQGFELSFSGRRPEMRLAGTRLDQLDRFVAPNGRRANVSTLGWVGIGVGALALTLGGFYLWLDEALDCDPGDECN
jgi:hypothetical protein